MEDVVAPVTSAHLKTGWVYIIHPYLELYFNTRLQERRRLAEKLAKMADDEVAGESEGAMDAPDGASVYCVGRLEMMGF